MTTDASATAYPNAAAVDEWLESIWALVGETPCTAEVMEDAGFTDLQLYHRDNYEKRLELFARAEAFCLS